MDTDFVSFRRRFLLLFICISIQGMSDCYDVEKSEKIFLSSYCLKKNCSARAH